jgi:hypothetical protein|tara:strand:+ start:153 stop:365 length:213 start_codon:yes stop_codon:yes gene_type:complete
MSIFGIAKRGLGLLGKKKLSPKQKRIKKENKKVAGLAAAALTGTAGYVGALYKKNLQDYPETGKNLKKSK